MESLQSVSSLAADCLPGDLARSLETVCEYRATRLLLALVVLGAGLRLYRLRARRRRRAQWAAVGKDVVVLHQFSRSKTCPNISPFAIKLETFLRANNIKYVVDESEPFGPRGKCPWITINGEEIADSQMTLIRLSRHFNISMDKGYSKEQLACGRAFQTMLEERTAWGIFLKRYTFDRMEYVWPLFPPWVRRYAPFVKYGMIHGMLSKAKVQGIGRFSEDEAMLLVEKDLLAVSTFLGDKPFLLGDTMTDFDCAVFGIVVQLLHASGPHLEFLTHDKFLNLVRYYERIKDLYWQDWDLCLET